jgi:hypothetical protein
VGFGRLIRIRTHRSDADATIYVVAEAEVDKAIAILQRAISQPNSEYKDLGRVSDTLLMPYRSKAGSSLGRKRACVRVVLPLELGDPPDRSLSNMSEACNTVAGRPIAGR